MKKNFFFDQIDKLQKQGIKRIFFLIKRIIFFIIDIALPLLLIPIILFIRILNPILCVRFGIIHNEHIGNFVFEPHYYLLQKKIYQKKTFDFFYYLHPDKVPNTFWDMIVRRNIKISQFVYYFYKANKLLPGNIDRHIIQNEKKILWDMEGLLFNNKTYFNFSREENKKGYNFLKEIGIENKEKFICLNVRDRAYNNKFKNWNNQDWSYHNYRNSDINTLAKTINELCKMGYWVFRMGKIVEQKLEIKNKKFIDYANSTYRSDFLDIWLMANCYFNINSARNGLDEVSRVYSKPLVCLNDLPVILCTTADHCILLPKKMIWKKNLKKLQLQEYLDHSYEYSHGYEKAGILVEDTNENDCLEAVIEMERRLQNKWLAKDGDIDLQNKFIEILKQHPDYKKNHKFIHPEFRVSTNFLRNNQSWLV